MQHEIILGKATVALLVLEPWRKHCMGALLSEVHCVSFPLIEFLLPVSISHYTENVTNGTQYLRSPTQVQKTPVQVYACGCFQIAHMSSVILIVRPTPFGNRLTHHASSRSMSCFIPPTESTTVSVSALVPCICTLLNLHLGNEPPPLPPPQGSDHISTIGRMYKWILSLNCGNPTVRMTFTTQLRPDKNDTPLAKCTLHFSFLWFVSVASWVYLSITIGGQNYIWLNTAVSILQRTAFVRRTGKGHC